MSLKDKNLFQSMTFILKFCKYFGYLSYEHEQISDQKIFMRTSTAHWVFWAILQTVFSILNIIFSYRAKIQPDSLSQMENIFFLLYFTIETVILFINQTFIKLFNWKILNIFNRLNEIEEDLRKNWKMRFNRVEINIVVLILMVIFALFMVLDVLMALTFPIPNINLQIWTFFMIIGVYSSQIAPALLFCTALSVSTEILNEINTYLHKNIIQRSPRYLATYHDDLKQFLHVVSLDYQHIFHAIRELKGIFGLPILLQIGMAFSVAVSHMYGITSVADQEAEEAALFLIIAVVLLLLYCGIVGVYVIVCELYARKVSILLR